MQELAQKVSKNRNQRTQDGFTIVELLIVIVVIAILAAISIVAYNGVQSRAATSALKSDLRNAASKLGEKHAIDGNYPDVTTVPPDVNLDLS